MMNRPVFYAPAPEAHMKKERAKAKLLRETQWWKQRLAKGICHYCEKKFDPSQLTMDHIIPVGRGGHSAKGNVVVACKACNTHKKHLTPAELILMNEPRLNNDDID
jgi:5-methylcytosine-specific restriction protein A